MQLEFDFGDEPEPDWSPLVKPPGITLAALLMKPGCRDCGGKPGPIEGVNRAGLYALCEECAALDACMSRAHDLGVGWHVSHWGDIHRAADHDALIVAREKRRTAWRRRAARSINEGE